MRNVVKALLVALVLAFAGPVAAHHSGAGLEAYQRGDYATAMREWRALAEQGDAEAQSRLAIMYLLSQGVPQDLVLAHLWLSLATDIDVYFCDPQSPWQRGSNENTNGLLRQYYPKGTDVSAYSQAHLNKVARQLNERPRKTLGFETPAERFNACVASTG